MIHWMSTIFEEVLDPYRIYRIVSFRLFFHSQHTLSRHLENTKAIHSRDIF